MDKAIVVFSRKGLFQTTLSAIDVRSREHARKLWPLVSTDESRQIVTWVSPSFNNGKLRRRSHFRILPHQHNYNPKMHFDEQEDLRWRAVQESPEHQRAKELVALELSRRLNSNLSMPWAFRDKDASDFTIEGDLLLGADKVIKEYPLSTPFGCQFRLDIAVLGSPVHTEPMVIGGVEIESGHVFDGRKALIGKSLGFPLISIDISEMTFAELTPEWANQVLTATTFNHEQGRRQTFIYLHDLLYPLYVQLPLFIDAERRHQFLIFADDNTLDKLADWMNKLAKKLNYANGEIAVAIVNAKNEKSYKMLERAGQVVGPDWYEFNNKRCLRLTVPRPKDSADLRSYRFHMTMARILLSHSDALVGYKYCNGIDNEHPEEDVWIKHHRNVVSNTLEKYHILPKRLAEPINRLIAVISSLQRDNLD